MCTQKCRLGEDWRQQHAPGVKGFAGANASLQRSQQLRARYAGAGHREHGGGQQAPAHGAGRRAARSAQEASRACGKRDMKGRRRDSSCRPWYDIATTPRARQLLLLSSSINGTPVRVRKRVMSALAVIGKPAPSGGTQNAIVLHTDQQRPVRTLLAWRTRPSWISITPGWLEGVQDCCP